MEITRDVLLARLATILGRDGSEGTEDLLRAVELLTGPRCSCCDSPATIEGLCDVHDARVRAREDEAYDDGEGAAERAAEQAAERYWEDRYEQHDNFEPPDYD